MKLVRHLLVLACALSPQIADASDVETGKRIALLRCAPCHIVPPNERRELAESLPFEAIASKFATNPELLVLAILAPHQRMNLTISPREAQDLAAYIATLTK